MAYLAGHTMAELLNAEKRGHRIGPASPASGRACASSSRGSTSATVGEFIYLYEMATSIAGALLDINTYDQPAVELGKKSTFALMGRAGYEKTAGELREQLRVDAAYLV